MNRGGEVVAHFKIFWSIPVATEEHQEKLIHRSE